MKKSITSRLLLFMLPAVLLVTITSCHKDHKIVPEGHGKYDQGFFVVNEGWYGHATGSVSFYSTETQTTTDSIFTTENSGLKLGTAVTTLEFGTVYNSKLYLLSKSGGPLVVTDASTLKETGRIASAPTNDWRAFLGVDATKGLVSTGNGVYPITLQTLALGGKLAGVTGQAGDMIKVGNYIFIETETDGVVILNAADYSVAKKIPGLSVGFAKTFDGSVWAAGGTSLVKINSATLATTAVALPFTVNDTWGAWHPGSITASTTDLTVYIAKNDLYQGANLIYKYTDGIPALLTGPFITLPAGKITYGAGVAYNPATNQLVVNIIKSGYGVNDSVNDLAFYNPITSALIKDIPFTGYLYPATPVFH